MSNRRYHVHRARQPIIPVADWAQPAWAHADVLGVDQFHPASSSHRPATRARMLYDHERIWIMFHVMDRFVRSVQTEYQSAVYTDSCVEFFVQPRPGKGYFNFEMNCCGTLLVHYVEDSTRGPSRALAQSTPLTRESGESIRIFSTLGPTVELEISQPVEWTLCCKIPLRVMTDYVGNLAPLEGQTWLGNFFKCGDETSHPHWASWSPIGRDLNFHQPNCFAPICFDEAQQM